jgi:spermidine/putrescine transport system ATP-binding protein
MAQTAMQNQRGLKPLQPLDVELRNVFKFFNQEPAIQGVDLDVRQGEFFSILGPSGCGKTTTLRLIAGFERVDAGKLLIKIPGKWETQTLQC